MAEKKDEIVNWDAEEYVVRDRKGSWYVILILVALTAIGLAIWLMRWEAWSFVALIVVSVVALIVYTKRPPRVLHYSVSNKGLSEGNKLYEFSEYKYFGVVQDEAAGQFSIVMVPKKRFGGRVTVYFPQESGEKIVDVFGARLPMETVEPDFIDKLVKVLKI
jgi:hypothetical protein